MCASSTTRRSPICKARAFAINRPAPDSFRAALRQAGFYAQWKGKFGNEAWDLLEQSVGKLA